MTDNRQASERYDIGLEEALSITLGNLKQLSSVTLSVEEVCGRVAAEDLFAMVDCPSATSSLRDGYAVVSKDIEEASKVKPVRLRLAGISSAGDLSDRSIEPGLAIKVLTGARLPTGADAVVSIEYTREEDGQVLCYRNAPAGRNVLYRGADVASGDPMAAKGEILTPGLTGLLAAGGMHRVRVIPMPRVGVVATGDEVVAPGCELKSGQLYASNLVTLYSWLRHFRMQGKTAVVRDHPDTIREAFSAMLSWADVLLTSGGAWKSERDLTVRVLEEMGCRVMFHRVRIGPGKAVAFGMIEEKAVFCLPGGPPSNEMAFLQIALPGLLHMAGRPPIPFQIKQVRITEPVSGDVDWTQFFQATLEKRGSEWWAAPQRLKSRLQSQARADALIRVPEGVSQLGAGDRVEVQMLTPLSTASPLSP
jgi:molybdopterin molybdotransferase